MVSPCMVSEYGLSLPLRKDFSEKHVSLEKSGRRYIFTFNFSAWSTRPHYYTYWLESNKPSFPRYLVHEIKSAAIKYLRAKQNHTLECASIHDEDYTASYIAARDELLNRESELIALCKKAEVEGMKQVKNG